MTTSQNREPRVRFSGSFTDAWEQRKLDDVTKSYSGGTPSVDKREYYGGHIPFIRSAEINSDTTELFLTDSGLANSSAKMVNVGDILYALYGATSGEVGIAQISGAINQAILAIKPDEGYDSQFIMQWLRDQKQNIIDKYLHSKSVDIMRAEPKVSAKAIADELGITSRAVEKNIAALKELGVVVRVGAAKGGHWEAKTPENGGRR
jgi:hypothetical protein